MAINNYQPAEGAKELILPENYLGEGGSGLHNVRLFLPISGTSIPIILRGGMGGNLVDWTSTRDFPSQGIDKSSGDATSDTGKSDGIIHR